MKIIHRTGNSELARDFARPPSIEQEVEFCKLIAVEELLQFMKRQGISRTNLAQRLGVAPSRITAMLSGDSNLTIETLVRAGHAVGGELKIRFQPAKTPVEKPKASETPISKVAEDPTPYSTKRKS